LSAQSVFSEILWFICPPRLRASDFAAMSLGTSRKVRALMIIIMLSVAEGVRRAPVTPSSQNERAPSRAAARGRRTPRVQASGAHRAASRAGGADAGGVTLTEQMDASITDPDFKNKAIFLAEQVESMMGDADIRGQASLIAAHMDAMVAEPSSVDHLTRVSELMEAMMNDPKFLEPATRAAMQMDERIRSDPKFAEFSEVVSQQKHAMPTGPSADDETTLVQMRMAMSDENVREQMGYVSQMLGALTDDPALRQQAVSLAEHIEAIKDGPADMEEATQVVKHVDSMMADPSLQKQARGVVKQMVAMMEQTKLSLEQMEAIKAEPQEQTAAAFVEVKSSSGQESTKARFAPGPVRAWKQLDRGPISAVEGQRLASPAPALEIERGHGPWMSMMGTAAHAPEQGMSDAGPAADTRDPGLTSVPGLKMLMPALINALRQRSPGPVMSAPSEKKVFSDRGAALLVFALWYVGAFYYNNYNKVLAKSTGALFPITIATMQLGVGFIYALLTWMVPNGRQRPSMSFKDYVSALPIAGAVAGVHLMAILGNTLGAVSFGHIIRSAEPAFAALIGTCLYGAKISTARWFTLLPVMGGVILASVGEVNFAIGALLASVLSNVFNAIRGNEIEKLLKGDADVSERIGGSGNLVSVMTGMSFLFMLPVMLLTEGKKLGHFFSLMSEYPSVLGALLTASSSFILLNEFGTKSVKMMGTVSNAVARTASRVVFIVVSGLMFKEGLGAKKLLGAGLTIGGALTYNVIDNVLKKRKQDGIANPPPQIEAN